MYEPRRRDNVRQTAPPNRKGGERAGTPPTGDRRPPQKRRPAPPKKRKKKNIGAQILFWTGAFFKRLLIIFVITAALGFWWYRSEFYSTVDSSGNKISYSVDDGSGTSFVASSSSAWSSGVLYTDFSALYRSFNLAQVGSLDSMRFIVTDDEERSGSGSGNEQYVIFTDGSRTANVNGTAVVMEARCRVIGESIWVPLSFIENYMDGVSVDHTSGDSVVLVSPEKTRAEKENKESKEPKKLKASDYPIHIDFRLKRSDIIESVKYPD